MPFIRYTRDKRGYETTFVMHGYRPAQGPQRTRVLYLFRSPSYVRMGRRPLDEEAREALEHTHPDVNFDWNVLGRVPEPVESDDRDGPRQRRGRGQVRAQRPARAAPSAVDDQSLLGRTLGSETAAGFRSRYSQLLERIIRRARTPEERDRLTEAAQRLNPDDWPDAEAVRAHAETIEQEWDAVAAELPSRRRGRRGGRRREAGGTEAESGAGEPDSTPGGPDPSGIMGGEGDLDEPHDVDTAGAGGDDRTGIDTSGHRPGPGDGAAGHDIPGDDEFRPD